MKTPLLLLSMFLGVVLTVHLQMNSLVGGIVNNPRVGNAVFWVIGAIMACIIGFSGWSSDALSRVFQVNPILLTAGAMGASLVFGIAWLFGQVGPGPGTLALLAGQIVSAMVLSHFGWIQAAGQRQPLTPVNLVGAVLLFIGVVLATKR